MRAQGEGNYAYACARVKARRAQLLPRETFPRLLKMGLAEIGRFLGDGQYRSEVDELSARHAGVDLIERATYLNLARTYQTILGFTRGELREMVGQYLNRWDVWNLKTVFRARTAGVGWGEAEAELVPAGLFTAADFSTIFHAPGAEEMVAALKREGRRRRFEPILLGVIKERGEVPGLAELENSLEKKYYEDLQASVRADTGANRLFLRFLKIEVDIVNLKTLLKLKLEGAGAETTRGLMIPGGEELSPEKLRRLAALEGLEPLVQELSGLKAFGGVREEAARVATTASLHEVLLGLDRYLLGKARSFSHLYPLSVLPVIDYILRKKIEVDNIRTIARGKQSGLPEETIQGLLFM
ncbi:MAG: ATP synthase A1 subunit C [Thermoplasmatota archaeon]